MKLVCKVRLVGLKPIGVYDAPQALQERVASLTVSTLRQIQASILRSLANVPPTMAIRCSSLRPGITRDTIDRIAIPQSRIVRSNHDLAGAHYCNQVPHILRRE